MEKQDHKQTKHNQGQQQIPHWNYSSLDIYRPSVALSFSYTSSEPSSEQSQDESSHTPTYTNHRSWANPAQ